MGFVSFGLSDLKADSDESNLWVRSFCLYLEGVPKRKITDATIGVAVSLANRAVIELRKRMVF